MKFTYINIIIILILLSCKDNLNLEVIVGENNENVIIHDLNPPFSVTDQNPDSIDLNGDSHYDLIFEKLRIPMTTGYGLETKMTKNSGVQVVLSSINSYPDSLSYSTNLNSIENWSDDSNETLILQSYLKRSDSNKIGNFILNEIKYLGIKMDNRYGWVKLANDRFGALIIYEYALMK